MAHRNYIGGIIKSLGLVFGDIGTSPIYTLPVIFLLTKPTEANVMGVLSLIIWTLVIPCFCGVCLACHEPWSEGGRWNYRAHGVTYSFS